jgi:Rrf2 family protein
MLALTKASGYGILALGYLDSLENESVVSAKEISEVFSIPNELLAKVLQRLTRAGFLEAHQGRGGGYSIACDTDQVSVADVVEAVEGPISIATCLRKGGKELCEQWDTCTIKTPVGIIQERLSELFASITVREITSGVELCPARELLPNTSL